MTKNKTALALIAFVEAASPNDLALARDVRRIRQRLNARPMDEILVNVPGNSVTEKCRQIGVSRTTYYSWLSGYTRPRNQVARRLAEITDIDIDVIRGRSVAD